MPVFATKQLATSSTQRVRQLLAKCLIVLAAIVVVTASQNARADHICSDVAVSDKLDIKNDGQLDAISGTAIVSTNSTSNNKLKVNDDGVATADFYVGVG